MRSTDQSKIFITILVIFLGPNLNKQAHKRLNEDRAIADEGVQRDGNASSQEGGQPSRGRRVSLGSTTCKRMVTIPGGELRCTGNLCSGTFVRTSAS